MALQREERSRLIASAQGSPSDEPLPAARRRPQQGDGNVEIAIALAVLPCPTSRGFLPRRLSDAGPLRAGGYPLATGPASEILHAGGSGLFELRQPLFIRMQTSLDRPPIPPTRCEPTLPHRRLEAAPGHNLPSGCERYTAARASTRPSCPSESSGLFLTLAPCYPHGKSAVFVAVVPARKVAQAGDFNCELTKSCRATRTSNGIPRLGSRANQLPARNCRNVLSLIWLAARPATTTHPFHRLNDELGAHAAEERMH
jgi:hypothetical protein